MKIKKSQVINLPVFTQGKKNLGKIIDIKKEPLSGEVVLFYVKAHSLITKLLNGTDLLIIPEEQVISIDKEKMIVKNLTDKEILSIQEMLKNNMASPAMSSEAD